jgi:hypothetical protein
MVGCSCKVSREGDLWAMALTCVTILKENGQVQYTSSYRAVSDDEMMNDNEKKEWELFDKVIGEKLGKPTTLEDLQSIDPDVTTPEYELCQDDIEGTHEHIPDIDNVTPEEQDNYVGWCRSQSADWWKIASW